MANNLYRAAASLYDLDPKVNSMDDIQFYIKRASMYPGDVLELACGTGRVTVPVAAAGSKIWGVDLSGEMLAQMVKKLDALPEDVIARITYIHSDMCDFDIDNRFSLIFIPFRSFQALTKETQQKACLERIRTHLAKDGRFIINVFRPYAFLDGSWIRQESFNWEVTDPQTGNMVRCTDHRKRIDPENQIIYPDLVYYIADGGGHETRIVEALSMRYYYEEQMRELLVSNGFTIEEEMGYYDGRPIKDGGELIYVCRKTAQ
jgi:ubiquinone/menaquinone biosynthesis C-methylase UbiE